MLTVRCGAVDAIDLLIHCLGGAENLDKPGRQFGIFGKHIRCLISLSLDAAVVFPPVVVRYTSRTLLMFGLLGAHEGRPKPCDTHARQRAGEGDARNTGECGANQDEPACSHRFDDWPPVLTPAHAKIICRRPTKRTPSPLVRERCAQCCQSRRFAQNVQPR
jgi:hypothetical protein